MIYRKLISVLGLVALFIQGAQGAAFNKKTIWDHRQIRLCTLSLERYMNSWRVEEWSSHRSRFFDLVKQVKEKTSRNLILSDTQNKIAEMRRVVDQAYSEEKTAIEFVDWNECPFEISQAAEVQGDRKNYDAVLLYFTLDQQAIDEYVAVTPDVTAEKIQKLFHDFSVYMLIGGQSEIGDISRVKPEKISLISLNTPLSQQDILHEFGHLSGLVHEHARAEAFRQDPFKEECNRFDDFPVIVDDGIEKKELRSFRYDPYSIMNYCQNYREQRDKTDNRSQLSVDDVKALLKVYRKMPAARPSGARSQ